MTRRCLSRPCSSQRCRDGNYHFYFILICSTCEGCEINSLVSGAREKRKESLTGKRFSALVPFYFAERFKVGVLAALHCSQPLPTLPRGNPHQHEAACVIPTPSVPPHRARLTPEGPLSPPPTLLPPSAPSTQKKNQTKIDQNSLPPSQRHLPIAIPLLYPLHFVNFV